MVGSSKRTQPASPAVPRRRGLRSAARVAGTAVALLLLGPAASARVVTIEQPLNLSTVIGRSQIELRLSPPQGATVEQVELWVDDRWLGVLAAPPWKAGWDAGDGTRGHKIEARARLSDGSVHRAVVRTSALRIQDYENVDLVNLYVVVRGPRGDYVTDLQQSDFRILENGREQRIDRFATTHKPLSVGLVLDTSLSMSRGDRLTKAKRAALSFLDVLQPGDEGLVVTFSDEVHVRQPLTEERERLERAIEATEASGGTALYDAIWRTARELTDFDRRRVIVLLSDGRDEHANGLEPGSLHTLDEALDQALRREVMIFAIGLGRKLDRQCTAEWDRSWRDPAGCPGKTQAEVLRSLARSTGGRALLTAGGGKLREAFDHVASDLRHQYSIAYVSSDLQREGEWREIQVFTPGRRLEVVTRKGYYAIPRGRSARDAAGPGYAAPSAPVR